MDRERTPRPSADDEITGLEGRPCPEPIAFWELAEAHRRAGRPQEAERVARQGLRARPEQVAGRVVLALALLDEGRADEARGELEQVVAPRHARALPSQTDDLLGQGAIEPADPLAGTLEDAELDRAFDEATPVADEVIDADRIAQDVIRQLDENASDTLRPSPGSPLATRTVADLLERQGDPDGAAAIRAGLRGPGEAPGQGARTRARASTRPQGKIQILERWLEQLRAR